MHHPDIRRVLDDQRFRRIIRRKQRVTLGFTLVLMMLFFGFVLLVAFAPGLLSTPLVTGGAITLYLVVSVVLLVLVSVLMNVFIAVKSRDRHDDIRELLAELRHQD